jgi:hypothetical protein
MSNWFSIMLYRRCIDSNVSFEKSTRRPFLHEDGRSSILSPESVTPFISSPKRFNESRWFSSYCGIEETNKQRATKPLDR